MASALDSILIALITTGMVIAVPAPVVVVVPSMLAVILIMAVEVLPALIMSAVVVVLPMTVRTLVAMPRHVDPVVPVISHEIHAPSARMVFGTVLGPVPFVARRHMQVDRRACVSRRRCDDHGLSIDY